MKYYSLKRSLIMALYNIIFFTICVVPILLIINLADIDEQSKGTLIFPIIIAVIFLLGPALFHLGVFFIYAKKASKSPVYDGTVFKWELGTFNKRYGRLCVVHEETEYTTPAVFYYEYAQQSIGKKIKYTIVDDMLIILEMIENTDN